MAIQEVGEVSYHVNNRLKAHWEKNSLEFMKKKNQDRVYIVDGMERSGKSWWTMQQAGVIDKEMFSSIEEFKKRVCYTPEEFFEAVRHVKNGVIIFDEAFRGLSSRSTLSKVNKKLIQALMEMGQNNNIVFIVLPRIFLLDKYPAMLRSNGLFNIYLDKKHGKRVWRGFNYTDKNKIYQIGTRKGWMYPIKTSFRGNFYNKFPGGEKFEKAYLEKKSRALFEMDEVGENKQEAKYKKYRDILMYIVYKYYHLSHLKLSMLMKQGGASISSSEIGRICQEVGEKWDKELVLPDKSTHFSKLSI